MSFWLSLPWLWLMRLYRSRISPDPGLSGCLSNANPGAFRSNSNPCTSHANIHPCASNANGYAITAPVQGYRCASGTDACAWRHPTGRNLGIRLRGTPRPHGTDNFRRCSGGARRDNVISVWGYSHRLHRCFPIPDSRVCHTRWAPLEVRLDSDQNPISLDVRLYSGAGTAGSFFMWPEELPGGAATVDKFEPAPPSSFQYLPPVPPGEYSLVVRAT